MVNSIEITIRSGIRELLSAKVKFDEDICLMNNKTYKIEDSFKEELLQTICLWKNEYGYDDKIDSEEFLVIVNSSDGKETIHGKGIFPDNYKELLRLLGDLND